MASEQNDVDRKDNEAVQEDGAGKAPVKRDWLEVLRKIALAVIVAIFALYVVLLGSRGIRYRRMVSELGDVVRLVPQEEQWEASGMVGRVSLGYMTLGLDKAVIAEVRQGGGAVSIKLADGLLFVFTPPVDGTLARPELEDVAARMGTKMDALAQAYLLRDFSWFKQMWQTQPKGILGYIFGMNRDERAVHVFRLKGKATVGGTEEIVIFEADKVVGAARSGVAEQPWMAAEVWKKTGGVMQTLLVTKEAEAFSATDESLVKAVVGSMEFTIDSVPDREELADLVADAAKKLPGYVETEPESDPAVEEVPAVEEAVGQPVEGE